MQTSAAPIAPHTPRDSIPNVPALGVARLAHRLGETRGVALEDGARAFRGEVARAEPGATGRHDEPGEPLGEFAQRVRDRVDAVGDHALVDDFEAGTFESCDERHAGTCHRACRR